MSDLLKLCTAVSEGPPSFVAGPFCALEDTERQPALHELDTSPPGKPTQGEASIMGVCWGALGAAPWVEAGSGQEAESCPAASASPPGAEELG